MNNFLWLSFFISLFDYSQILTYSFTHTLIHSVDIIGIIWGRETINMHTQRSDNCQTNWSIPICVHFIKEIFQQLEPQHGCWILIMRRKASLLDWTEKLKKYTARQKYLWTMHVQHSAVVIVMPSQTPNICICNTPQDFTTPPKFGLSQNYSHFNFTTFKYQCLECQKTLSIRTRDECILIPFIGVSCRIWNVCHSSLCPFVGFQIYNNWNHCCSSFSYFDRRCCAMNVASEKLFSSIFSLRSSRVLFLFSRVISIKYFMNSVENGETHVPPWGPTKKNKKKEQEKRKAKEIGFPALSSFQLLPP